MPAADRVPGRGLIDTLAARLNVVLCWHMHQPDYRLGDTWQRPWTWLHAIKDYTDMAAHLEQVPGARAVVNFSPVLLRQLEDLGYGLSATLADGRPAGEPLLDALAGRAVPDEAGLQRALLRVHPQNMAARFTHYRELAGRAAADLSAGRLLPRAERDDLLCWYVLCWLGESLRADPRVAPLHDIPRGFGETERRALLAFIADAISGLIPRYRALAQSGSVELSVTPYAHPILPLLQDFAVAREAEPGVPLPPGSYPGGERRAEWHLGEAVRAFRHAFGFDPRGCWPAEGGISAATLEAVARHGFQWTASGSRVLHASLDCEGGWPQCSAWKPGHGESPVCFFRDDGLSDRIGFVYGSWRTDDAVADFIGHLERVRVQLPRGQPAVLAIIMDGENAWEYYPENGQPFLRGLYGALAEHPHLRLATFSELMPGMPVRSLPRLVSGSWVHGTFSTWIGRPARNRAWELLIGAKQAVDMAWSQRGGTDPEWRRKVVRQLALCEASDWFWWLDENNEHPDVDDFDELFRRQLAGLYRLARTPPPEALTRPLLPVRRRAAGGDSGAMRRSGDGD